MWVYEKKLQFPVEITHPDAKSAAVILSQLGGADGEMGAALRYLSQRYTMPYPQLQALLTDIATEEMAHVELISAILYQLTDGLTIDSVTATTSRSCSSNGSLFAASSTLSVTICARSSP